MLVRDYMTRHPLMVHPGMTIVEAQRFMGESGVRHLPVAGDGKRLIGLITRHSLLIEPSAMGSLNVWEIAEYLSRLTVSDVMIKRKDVVTVNPDTTIEDAARIMVEKKVGCLPVLEDNVLVGIITEHDLLAQLMEMMAAGARTVRVTMRIPNVKGELARLVAAISAQGWGILACGGVDTPKDPSHWDVVVKIQGVPKEQIVAALSKIEGQTIVDVRET